MKRLAPLLLITCLAFTAQAEGAKMRLTESMAWDYAELTMDRKYGAKWDSFRSDGGDITCRKRLGRLVRRCALDWSPGGDVGYYTRLRVVWRGGYAHHRVRVAGATRTTNYYCLIVKPKSKWRSCTSRHRVGPVRYRFP